MDRDNFNRTLANEGFPAGVLVVRDANGFTDLHTHSYEAKALIISGELRIVVDGKSRTYAAGQVFHLAANLPHTEYYGPQGVEFLVGRKETQPAQPSA